MYNCNQKYYYNPYLRGSDRGLLLPFLVGAAIAFPIGYIASNTNNNKTYGYMNYYPTPYYYPNFYYNPYMNYNMPCR